MDIELQELTGDAIEDLNIWVRYLDGGPTPLVVGGLAHLAAALEAAAGVREHANAITKPVLRELHAIRNDVLEANETIKTIAERVKPDGNNPTDRPTVSRCLKRAAERGLAAKRVDGSYVVTPAGVAYAILKHPAKLKGNTLEVDARDVESEAVCWLLTSFHEWDETLSGRALTPAESEIVELLGGLEDVGQKPWPPLVKKAAQLARESARNNGKLSRYTVPKLAKRLNLQHGKGGYSLPYGVSQE